MDKKLIILIPLMIFATLLLGQNTTPEKNRLNNIKAAPNVEKPMDNPYKDLDYGSSSTHQLSESAANKEGIYFLEDSTTVTASEYWKEKLVTDNTEKAIEPFTIPQGKEIWFFESVKAYDIKGLAKADELTEIQLDIKAEFTTQYQVISIEQEQIILINQQDRNYLTIEEAKGRDNTTTEDCSTCTPQKFTIDTEKSTTTEWIVEIPYDDNPNIIIQLTFGKVIRP